MAGDPRPHPPRRLQRLLVAAVAFAVIAVVAYVGSALLFGPSLSNVPLLWMNFGAGPNDDIKAVSTEPIVSETSAVANTTATKIMNAPLSSRGARRYTPTHTPSPVPTDTPTPMQPEAVVSVDALNLRAGPGTNYSIIDQVRAEQRFRITGRNEAGDWLRVCCPAGENTESWINAAFAQSNLPIKDLPVTQSPPTSTPTILVPDLTQIDPSLPGPGGVAPPSGTNPLTRQPLAAGRNVQRPIVVCINNDIAARPQFGLSRADVMYEYLMEGFSLTRFSAVFYGADSEQIGPVRSARLINYYMGSLYDAGLFCSGASDSIRTKLKANDALFPYLDVDIDDPDNNRYSFSVGTDYRTRLRTNSDLLRLWLAEWGVDQAPLLQGFTFGRPVEGGTPAGSIKIPYPSVTASQVAYRYDEGSGRYWRFLGGAAHRDGNNGQQIAVENVIVQYISHNPVNIVEDSFGNLSLHIGLFGTGKALVFRDGLAFEGSWRSNSGGELPRFFSADGSEIPLKAGRSWISIVPLTYEIAYQ